MSAQQGRSSNQQPQVQSNSDLPAPSKRLWSPWRLKYIAKDAVEAGCIFCNRLASDDDTQALILRRTDHAFVIMNLFPYNTGHVMIVPNRHVADPEELAPDELIDLGLVLPDVLRALRGVFTPAGFNVGMNIGAVAGAGVADHLHQHVVPRWQGDANFMPIIAGVMVLPELIPTTYAKVRAELERSSEPGEANQVTLVVLNWEIEKLLVTQERTLPVVEVDAGEAIYRASANHLHSLGFAVDLAGWAGPASTNNRGRAAFTYLASAPFEVSDAVRWVPVESALSDLENDEDRVALRQALSRDLTIASAPPGWEAES